MRVERQGKVERQGRVERQGKVGRQAKVERQQKLLMWTMQAFLLTGAIDVQQTEAQTAECTVNCSDIPHAISMSSYSRRCAAGAYQHVLRASRHDASVQHVRQALLLIEEPAIH